MWTRKKGPGKWCPENDGAYQAEQAAIHAVPIPPGQWCACGFPHETGGPCWECREFKILTDLKETPK